MTDWTNWQKLVQSPQAMKSDHDGKPMCHTADPLYNCFSLHPCCLTANGRSDFITEPHDSCMVHPNDGHRSSQKDSLLGVPTVKCMDILGAVINVLSIRGFSQCVTNTAGDFHLDLFILIPAFKLLLVHCIHDPIVVWQRLWASLKTITTLPFKVIFIWTMHFQCCENYWDNCFLLSTPVGTIYKPSKPSQTKNCNELIQNKWKEVMAARARQNTLKHHPI